MLCYFSYEEMGIEEALLTEIAQAELILQNYKEVEHGKLRAYETLVFIKNVINNEKSCKTIWFCSFIC